MNTNLKQMFSATLRPQGAQGVVGALFQGLEQQEQRKEYFQKNSLKLFLDFSFVLGLNVIIKKKRRLQAGPT